MIISPEQYLSGKMNARDCVVISPEQYLSGKMIVKKPEVSFNGYI
jgi:hypothetical protein